MPRNARTVIGEYFRVAKTPDTLGTLNADITAADTSIELAGGYSSLDSGYHVVLIGSELILCSQTAGALTVETYGRGYFGTTAAIHVATATVSIAVLNSMVGSNVWDFAAKPSWKNATPGIIFTCSGGENTEVNGAGSRDSIRKPRAHIKSCGGQDSEGNYPDIAAEIIDRAVLERIYQTTEAETLTSGRMLSARCDSDSQPLKDTEVKPIWPFVLRFVNFEIV